MKISNLTVVITTALLTLAAVASEAPKGSKIAAAAAFERFKGLAGDWESKHPNGGQARASYQVLAGGSAVLERFTDSTLPAGGEMITVYHLDGDRLLLTHYCLAQNQPRMRASRFEPSTGELEFEFLDATNLKGPGAGHMHSVKFRFVDADHFTSEWQFFEDNKPKFTEAAQYTRVR